MYYFNYALIKELPKLYRMSKHQFGQISGIGHYCLRTWGESCSMSVGKFVEFLNLQHLSMADFLIDVQTPIIQKRKEDYVIPDELWEPIEWHSNKIASLCGKGSITGVSSKEAFTKSLGYANTSCVVAWITDPMSMKMSTLLSVLNLYKLDAKIFFTDNNRPIINPSWKIKTEVSQSVVSNLEELIKENKKMRSVLKERDSLIAQMRQDKDRLQRENEFLRRSKPSNAIKIGFAAESDEIQYGFPSFKRKIVFHRDLWESLPSIFGMTTKAFRGEFGLAIKDTNNGNVRMDKLIEVCNALHISIMHFFIPVGEPLTVNHRSWYEISPRLFKPITSRMENLNYIFKKGSFGLSRQQLEVSEGIWNGGFNGFMKEGGRKRMVLTVLNICNSFNLPMSVFVSDPNDRKRPSYSVSLNETLIENCVNMAKELEKCRRTIRELKRASGEPEGKD